MTISKGHVIAFVLVALFIAAAAATVAVLTINASFQGSLRSYQLTACDRGKLDRKLDVGLAAALARYYQGVAGASSVKGDVKELVTDVQHAAVESAIGKRSRISKCKPLVEQQKDLPDEKVLKTLPPVVDKIPEFTAGG